MIEEKVVEFLKKKSGYVSGEDLSNHLRISRQALWKHIQNLRELDYDIVAVPHLGYQLRAVPDRLLPFEVTDGLSTRCIGRKIYYFESVSSTMDIAVKLGLDNAPEGSLVIAETQTKGRGRLSRQWHSPKYKGIYLSLLLRPRFLLSETPLLTLLSAVSVCEGVKEASGLECRIKWPNDILLGNKKVGGILTELNAEADEMRFVVIGIGLNVNNDKGSLPGNSISLGEYSKKYISRIGLLQKILVALEDNYLLLESRGGQPIIQKWRAFNTTIGRKIRVISHDRHSEGIAVDIDKDGSLLLKNESGRVERITAGDVTHCRHPQL
ncbi:MAG: biotin--[acetyl-CoA-carboxylase] ligase [Candidatus Omnitrophota bacterium]